MSETTRVDTLCHFLRSVLQAPSAELRLPDVDLAELASYATGIAQADPDPSRPYTLLASGTIGDLLPAVATLISGRPLLVLDARREPALIEQACAAARALSPAKHPSAPGRQYLQPASQDPALLISTSGTTSGGKLWSRSQGALLHQAIVQGGRLDGQGKTFAHLGHFQTTAAINAMALALQAGANYRYLPVHGDSEQPVLDMLRSVAPSFVTCTPTLFRSLARADTSGFGWPLEGLWLVGEKVTASDLELFHQATPAGASLLVRYGSTETGNIAATRLDQLSPPFPSTLPSGPASPGVEIRILGSDGSELASGEPGSIVVRSLTSATAVGHSPVDRYLQLDGGAPFFDVGDEGYLGPAGDLYVLGRRDGMVKFRGERLDAPALEARLSALEDVEQALFMTVPGPSANEVLVLAIHGNNSRAIRRAREILSARSGIERLATVLDIGAFPLTAAHKTDLSGIRLRVTEQLVRRHQGEAPRTPAENLVADCWAEVLGIECPSRDIAIEELGGDSLAMVAITVQLEREFGLRLPDESLEYARTVASQAAALRPADDPAAKQPLIDLGGSGDRILVCCPGIGGHSWSFGPLARAMGPDVQVYGLGWHMAQPEQLASAVIEAAAGRTIIPLGYSGGARSAWLLAEHCIAAGAEVQTALVLDGSTRQRFGRRHLLRAVRRALRPRNATDRYLLKLSYAGRRWQMGKALYPLEVDVHEIRCVKEEAANQAEPVSQWQALGRSLCSHNVEHDHYRLVRPPVPGDVVAIIRQACGLQNYQG